MKKQIVYETLYSYCATHPNCSPETCPIPYCERYKCRHKNNNPEKFVGKISDNDDMECDSDDR